VLTWKTGKSRETCSEAVLGVVMASAHGLADQAVAAESGSALEVFVSHNDTFVDASQNFRDASTICRYS